jgi:tungstate transport system substrate-binding protein
LRVLSARGATWVSRGDSSGTHRAELRLLALARPDVGGLRVIEAGQGMAETLVVASERGAYMLTDRSTFLTLGKRLALDVLVEGDARLRNVYSVITVRDARNAADATTFAAWLLSPQTARLIGDFGREQYGSSLFTPVTTHGAAQR